MPASELQKAIGPPTFERRYARRTSADVACWLAMHSNSQSSGSSASAKSIALLAAITQLLCRQPKSSGAVLAPDQLLLLAQRCKDTPNREECPFLGPPRCDRHVRPALEAGLKQRDDSLQRRRRLASLVALPRAQGELASKRSSLSSRQCNSSMRLSAKSLPWNSESLEFDLERRDLFISAAEAT